MKGKYIFLFAVIVWNIIVFAMYGIDKRKAKKNKWRISETTLVMSAFLLGGAGAFAGMKVFHHKTLHTTFKILVPIFAVTSTLLVIYILYLY